MGSILSAVVSLFSFRFRSRASLEIELIAVRHQLAVLRRQWPGRPQLSSLRRFPDCGEAWGVVVVGLDAEISGAAWTVSRFNRGESSAHACDRALQVIVPHYQRLYDLTQKH